MAQQTTYWHNAIELLPQDSNVTIVPGALANSMDVQMSIIDTRFIVLPLTLPSDRIIRSKFPNYRIGPAEIGALGLLTTANEFEVLYALVDWQTFLSYP